MNRVVDGLIAIVALQAGLALAQAAPPSHASHHGRATPLSKESPAAKPPVEGKTGEARAYTSAFADYRPFDPQEPAKPWRAANDEVREAGGHVGLMKGAGRQFGTAKGAKP